jgi:CubicO group peptidase (beta-lactamase class C family)
VSKQFTAMAILLLVAGRRLALDDPPARFFAAVPPHWRHITLQHLLMHTAGLLDYEELILSDTATPLHDQGVLDLVRPTPTAITPLVPPSATATPAITCWR